jgi:glutamate-ammonia-ligase adenylyltransferase
MVKTKDESLSINTNIQSQCGHLTLIELPELNAYSTEELTAAGSNWPAIQRYLGIISQAAKTPADHLRLKRQHSWLRCALSTYFHRNTAEEITLFWSRKSEEFTTEAWQLSESSRWPVAVFALGKLGAEELNLSSDIDLILVRADGAEVPPKPFRDFQNLLSEYSGFGFVLRVDLNLRPGGRASAILPSVSEFENHYGYQGEMWERLAWVRGRALAGPDEITNPVLGFARKFSYRKHLDYTVLEDLKVLRAKIRSEHFNFSPDEFHLKLGVGGIRDIELFIHSLQVIHGGRQISLQTHSTSQALKKIRELKLLPEADCDFLLETYWYLRDLENRLQATEDQQNYILQFKNFARLQSRTTLEELKERTQKAAEIVSSLLGSKKIPTAEIPASLEAQQEWLTQMGFRKVSIEEIWPQLIAATALSKKSSRDEAARQHFLFSFVEKLHSIGRDRDLGLALLLDFVKAGRAKASLFTLLNREPRLIEDLSWLFSSSPYLGNILASRPELLDSFIYRAQQDPSKDLGTLLEELTERRLLVELISANRFLSDRDLTALCLNISSSADKICKLLLEAVKQDLDIPSSQVSLLALGKWGGSELGLRSDLDFVFISPTDPTSDEQKLARRFLMRLTEQHKGGSIYAVDMRLRPSGNAGPILVSAIQLKSYLQNEAAAWERQAYLKARSLSKLDFHPAEVAASRGLSASDQVELSSIRKQLFKESSPGAIDLKMDFGGLADLEFTAQQALLAKSQFSLDPSTLGMIECLKAQDENWAQSGDRFFEIYRFLRLIEQFHQLAGAQSGTQLRPKSETFQRLAMVAGIPATELEAKLRAGFKDARELIAQLNPLLS